jgi:hypothetical protein
MSPHGLPGEAVWRLQNLLLMEPLDFLSRSLLKPPSRPTAAFSLAAVSVALGIAMFCLVALLGLLTAASKTQQSDIQQATAENIITGIEVHLRTDTRPPPDQPLKEQISAFGLHGDWGRVNAPETLFFCNDAQLVGGPYSGTADPPAPAGATFRAKITYLRPPNISISAATVSVSWPAQAIPATGTPAGKIEAFIAVDR